MIFLWLKQVILCWAAQRVREGSGRVFLGGARVEPGEDQAQEGSRIYGSIDNPLPGLEALHGLLRFAPAK